MEGEGPLKNFLFGLVLGVLLVPLAVFGYFVGGYAPVATASKAMPFERRLAASALHAHISQEMPKTVPLAADDSSYSAGAEIYRQDCAVCHGLPGEGPTAIARGMFPHAPQLFRGKGVTDDEAGETYWKVENGIRLTGMPGFGKSLSETQMWQVSLLLANADKLPDSVKQSLATGPAAPTREVAPKR
jgi:mono/diheme cytochrome c family protein